jgi:hypothetical protein
MAKASKGHGGARDGAGRPPLLSWEQETWFCARLENRLNEIAKAAAIQKGHEAERKRAKRRDSSLSFDAIEQLNEVSPDYVELRWKEYRRDLGLTHRRPKPET